MLRKVKALNLDNLEYKRVTKMLYYDETTDIETKIRDIVFEYAERGYRDFLLSFYNNKDNINAIIRVNRLNKPQPNSYEDLIIGFHLWRNEGSVTLTGISSEGTASGPGPDYDTYGCAYKANVCGSTMTVVTTTVGVFQIRSNFGFTRVGV